jgi:hypothetical protein
LIFNPLSWHISLMLHSLTLVFELDPNLCKKSWAFYRTFSKSFHLYAAASNEMRIRRMGVVTTPNLLLQTCLHARTDIIMAPSTVVERRRVQSTVLTMGL